MRRVVSKAGKRNVTRFRGGLGLKAHRPVCHSTLGLRVINKKKKKAGTDPSNVGEQITQRATQRFLVGYHSYPSMLGDI